MDKNFLRNFYKNALNELDEYQLKEDTLCIIRNLLDHPIVKKSKNIMCYVSLNGEISTFFLINYLFLEGKKVSVPLVGDYGQMIPIYISSVFELEKGSFGILEPKYSPDKEAKKDDIDLVIVPGVCFDKNCNRLGKGKGYYDRFLKDFKGIKIGICHHKCLAESLQVESHDIIMDFVITDKGIVTASS